MTYRFKVGDRVQRKAAHRDEFWCTAHCPDEELVVTGWRSAMPYERQELQLKGSNGKLWDWYWDAPKFDLVQTFREEGSARASDPATSKAAAKIKRTPLRERVWIVICGGYYEPRPQGWTGKELAEYMKVPLNSITPRFAELRKQGKIKDSDQRRDGQIVWVLA